jgi:hypothetical protein
MVKGEIKNHGHAEKDNFVPGTGINFFVNIANLLKCLKSE